jgi:hypothetical protein
MIPFEAEMKMSEIHDSNETGAKTRDRSPSYPSIGLEKAVERTRQLFAKAKRFDVRLADAATDWELAPKSSSTLQLVASLLSYGLIESSIGGDGRKIKVSEIGRRILEDHRPGVRESLLAEAALKPKLIAEYADHWKDGRPDDQHSISQLKFESGFTDDGARKFLRVFDETIPFAQISSRDNALDKTPEVADSVENLSKVAVPPDIGVAGAPRSASPLSRMSSPMSGERELTTGLLAKDASFRLIVSGRIGAKEIDRLIQKLQLDKEILAASDDDHETS